MVSVLWRFTLLTLSRVCIFAVLSQGLLMLWRNSMNFHFWVSNLSYKQRAKCLSLGKNSKCWQSFLMGRVCCWCLQFIHSEVKVPMPVHDFVSSWIICVGAFKLKYILFSREAVKSSLKGLILKENRAAEATECLLLLPSTGAVCL